jgi:hypothetical protein
VVSPLDGQKSKPNSKSNTRLMRQEVGETIGSKENEWTDGFLAYFGRSFYN